MSNLIRLHQYFRSSASYRLRIALNLKGLAYESVAVDLPGGAQFSAEFGQTNPAQLVPVLEDAGEVLTQSLAIIEYLDERWPQPALLPRTTPADRAYVRSLALAIACDIHPLNNLRVLKYLTGPLGQDETAKNDWYRHWVTLGFAALETRLAASPRTGLFCFGDTPTLADICLVPQIANAARVDTDMGPYPTLRRIEQNCAGLDAFQRAHPMAQPEAQSH
ncbi:MAG: maleylacetoacetate isomerase [Panacagrimonas sp.]